MKKILILTIFAIMLFSSISAEIVISQQPNNLYNLEDTITLPLKIKSLTDTNGLLAVYLICNGIETEVYKEYLFLIPGEEKERNPSVPLIKNFIGRSTGKCRIKCSMKDEIELTNEFKISDVIKINVTSEKKEFAPGEEIAVDIEAIKENGNAVEGFVVASVSNVNNSENIETSNSVTKGYSHIVFTTPKNTKAGEYTTKIEVSEKDSKGAITNFGSANYKFTIVQVPTSLEIIFKNASLDPGARLEVKTVLHDQTGEAIFSNVTLTVKNSDGLVMEKVEKLTKESFDFPIASNEPPGKWTLIAESNSITTESPFEILEKKLLETIITNDTLKITNIGNVFYNDVLLVKIGNSSVSMNVSLGVGESKEYLITAPDGIYKIEVISHEGKSTIQNNIPLTGKTISIKEPSQGVVAAMKHPFVWFFIAGIMGFVIIMVLRKGYRKSFVGSTKTFVRPREAQISKRDLLLNSRNKAELSLSIKGGKQNVSLLCLKLKNFREIKSNRGETEETLQRVARIAEESRAEVYENQESIFLIFTPTKTKSTDNEKRALDTAMKIKEVFDHHNKIFRQVIDFGISVNYGVIIANYDGGHLKFMSMGTLITTAKRIAMNSNGEVLLDEKIKEKLGYNIRTQKQGVGNLTSHAVKEIKNSEQNKKFITSFLNRQEKGN